MFGSPYTSSDFTGTYSYSDEPINSTFNKKQNSTIDHPYSGLDQPTKHFELPTFSKKLDISSMKDKLDKLLKQTDDIEKRKNHHKTDSHRQSTFYSPEPRNKYASFQPLPKTKIVNPFKIDKLFSQETDLYSGQSASNKKQLKGVSSVNKFGLDSYGQSAYNPQSFTTPLKNTVNSGLSASSKKQLSGASSVNKFGFDSYGQSSYNPQSFTNPLKNTVDYTMQSYKPVTQTKVKQNLLKFQQADKKQEQEYSVSQFISLRYKNQNLEEKVKSLKTELESKNNAIEQQKTKQRDLIERYQQQLDELKKKHQTELLYEQNLVREAQQASVHQVQLLKKEHEQHLYVSLHNQQEIIENLENQIQQQQHQHQAILKNQQAYFEGIINQEIQMREQLNMAKNQHIKELVSKLTGDVENNRVMAVSENLAIIMNENQQLINILHEKDHIIGNMSREIEDNNEQVLEFLQNKSKYESRISELEAHIQSINLISSNEGVNFDQVLKAQLSQNQILQQKNANLTEQNSKLKENIDSLKRTIDTLHNDLQVQEIKEKTNRNNHATEMEMVRIKNQNQLKSLHHKHSTVSEKYQLAQNQIKAKDEFVKEHLKGQVNQSQIKQYIDHIFKQYEQDVEELRAQLDAVIQDNTKLTQKVGLYERQ